MKQIMLEESLFRGAVSVEKTTEYVKPWRIPFEKAALFVPDYLEGKTEIAAGVRITFRSNTTSIKINILPAKEDMEMDLVINGFLIDTGVIETGKTTVTFDLLSADEKLIEIYLSQRLPVRLTALWIEDVAEINLSSQSSPRWIAYGSSITQCVDADSPSHTWPALAAGELEFDLTCLGFDGNCHLETMVAHMIRDLEADVITLCVGINIKGRNTFSQRAFVSALLGFIQIIREKHVSTPIVLISPIFSRNNERQENNSGLNLIKIREEIVHVTHILRENGDYNLHYMNGLELFGQEYEPYLHDGLHPSAEGYRMIAQRFREMMCSQFSHILNQIRQ